MTLLIWSHWSLLCISHLLNFDKNLIMVKQRRIKARSLNYCLVCRNIILVLDVTASGSLFTWKSGVIQNVGSIFPFGKDSDAKRARTWWPEGISWKECHISILEGQGKLKIQVTSLTVPCFLINNQFLRIKREQKRKCFWTDNQYEFENKNTENCSVHCFNKTEFTILRLLNS